MDSVTRILQIISNSVRRSIVHSLKGTSMMFSELMRESGLNPNYDTGPFYYHLSILLDSCIIEKKGDEYRLTTFGDTIASFIDSLQRESAFLLKTEKPKIRGEKRMKEIEAKWLSQDDIKDGVYGIVAGPVEPRPDEVLPEDPQFNNWQETLPMLEMPPRSFFGHILGFEKDGAKLGSIHVRFCYRRKPEARGATAQILGIYTVDNNYRKIGLTRSSLLQHMMEEFLRQFKENHGQSVEIDIVNAEDEDLVNVLKKLGFERCLTTYMMRTTILS